MGMHRAAGLCLALVGAAAASGWAGEPEARSKYEHRWFYASHNLLVEKNVDDLISLIERAGRSGYNGVLLADYKFNILGRMPPKFFQHVERVRKAAAEAGIEIIPAVVPIGYSDGLLAHDPNLAEGLPVRDAPFVVRGREAVPVPDPATRLVNGDLEQTQGDRFPGFSFQDDPGKVSFADRDVTHGGKVSCRIEDPGRNSSSGNARLIQRVKVRPNACYRLSCWARTKDLSSPGAFRLLALGAKGGRALTFHEGGIEPSQDWKRVDVVFNSLDQDEVNLYAGLWGGRSGTLWLDDLALDELSLVNVLRRDGCPLTVSSSDGKTIYEEGKDFEPVRDDKLGMEPYAGVFGFQHEGPTLRLTGGSRIKDGDRLLVSWYHPILTHGSQVMCCLSEPKVYELLRDQAARIDDLFHPKTVLMSHDEIRVANWCQACQKRGVTPGALLADNARRCVEILKQTIPVATVAVWSDMFDPNHNAVDRYYLVNGSFEGSWKGLPPEVLIANWNSGKARASLEWFSGRGHPQLLAGYYDADDLGDFRRWDAAAKGVPRVSGFMYTTWRAKYGLLETYGRAISGQEEP
jgi:hypothetical protein